MNGWLIWMIFASITLLGFAVGIVLGARLAAECCRPQGRVSRVLVGEVSPAGAVEDDL